MEHYTKQTGPGQYKICREFLPALPEDAGGPAADRLGAFERVYEHLAREKETTEKKMEELRKKGRTGSATFRQLMAKKVNLGNMLDTFAIYGIQ
ncbi:MAG TPA: hypothetical protein IAA57_01590 [Candidatus Pullilachnospira intestinigallinarum]|nr:hypothetical protein [Candidatus Pullilachnospira intestinigallinarum]